MALRRNATKRIKSKNIHSGIAHIHSSHQNTIVAFTDLKGNMIAWSSAGASGFKGTKKKTAYAAGKAAEAASLKARDHGIAEVEVRIQGMGQGRDAARKQIEVSGINVKKITDVTPLPHNGTRPPKRVLKRAKVRK